MPRRLKRLTAHTTTAEAPWWALALVVALGSVLPLAQVALYHFSR